MGEKGRTGFFNRTEAPVEPIETTEITPQPIEGELGPRPEVTDFPEGGELGRVPLE